ncbi:hypothetical protein [Plesiocystis pacifica]|uniref:hypothetical protein n=1 Tax=Plesiocystis pacifica TaxID=191768 RepID=UPI0012FC6C94|nr:hypothetical protein [Plesiocystis pacifica]
MSDGPTVDAPTPEADERREPPLAAQPLQSRVARWLFRNSWLVLAVGAGLIFTRVVDFEPPEQVRIDETSVDLVGEAPAPEFDSQLDNPQAVQMRATLRCTRATTWTCASPIPRSTPRPRSSRSRWSPRSTR